MAGLLGSAELEEHRSGAAVDTCQLLAVVVFRPAEFVSILILFLVLLFHLLCHFVVFLCALFGFFVLLVSLVLTFLFPFFPNAFLTDYSVVDLALDHLLLKNPLCPRRFPLSPSRGLGHLHGNGFILQRVASAVWFWWWATVGVSL